MSKQSPFGRKMNLNFIAEHTADLELAETFLRNWGILEANPSICNTCSQKMSEVKIGRSGLTVWRSPKQKRKKFD